MKRKALLIGNTSGLPGVKIDINNLSTFLLSDKGGAWYSTEIEILLNPTKIALLARIDQIRREQFDYSMVMYSGHGGQRRETMLEINAKSEQIPESSLKNISLRQVNIYDCCRCYLEPLAKAEDARMKIAAFTESAKSSIRVRYDTRMMQAIPQQSSLYSCSIGQASYDTPEGAVYLGNLIKSALRVEGQYKLLGVAHEESVRPTTQHSINKGLGTQTPESNLPKCVTTQQLIISINPFT